MSAQEEYAEFLECYYLDYNILNSILSFWEYMDIKSYQTSFLSYCFLSSFYNLKKICIPYSTGHICDILSGEKNIDNKINIINEISKGWYVSEDDEDNNIIRIDKCNDVKLHFNNTKDSIEFTKDIQNIFDPLIELAFKQSFKNYTSVENIPEELNNKIKDLLKEKIVKSIYDVFQFNYKIINILNVKNNINFKHITKEKLIKDIEILISQNIFLKSINVKNINDFKIFHESNLYNFKQSNFSKKVFMYSFLSDYVGLTKEDKDKVSKDTFASGMINDLIHLSLGLRCSIFVTNDKNLYIKAIFCKILLDLNVKIFSIEHFYQYIINEYIMYNYPIGNDKDIIIKIKFNDIIFEKTIKTDFSKTLYM
jgi:hypothetical protein